MVTVARVMPNIIQPRNQREYVGGVGVSCDAATGIISRVLKPIVVPKNINPKLVKYFNTQKEANSALRTVLDYYNADMVEVVTSHKGLYLSANKGEDNLVLHQDGYFK